MLALLFAVIIERALAETQCSTVGAFVNGAYFLNVTFKSSQAEPEDMQFLVDEGATVSLDFIIEKRYIDMYVAPLTPCEVQYLPLAEHSQLPTIVCESVRVKAAITSSEPAWQLMPRIGFSTMPLGDPLLTLQGMEFLRFDSTNDPKRCCGQKKCLKRWVAEGGVGTIGRPIAASSSSTEFTVKHDEG
mmetsp:Transcript_13909/g.25635  ORF Transcript_13909/g.25635 Transcript_13909/m.25635 type:complete len:188 (-) Transcript_13909:22-585(-)